MAARSGGAAQSVILLSAYSAGLAVPFIAAGLFFDRLAPLWAWFKKHGLAVRIVSGLLLVVIGLSMALGRLTALNAITARLGIGIKSFAASQPEATMAISLTIIGVLAALLVAVPVLRGRRFARPVRLVVLGVLLLALLLQALGVVSFAGIVAGWLMFQGA
jgi:cytochrome c-type biogenesis protein